MLSLTTNLFDLFYLFDHAEFEKLVKIWICIWLDDPFRDLRKTRLHEVK